MNNKIKTKYLSRQQGSRQIDYNDYWQGLSTLHTVMLHDTIVSQDENDGLMLLPLLFLALLRVSQNSKPI